MSEKEKTKKIMIREKEMSELLDPNQPIKFKL